MESLPCFAFCGCVCVVVGSISPAMPTQLALHQSFIPSPQFHAPGSYPVVTPSQPFLNTVVSQCAPTSANAGTGELQAVRAYTSPYTSIASTLQMSGPLEFASPEQHWKPLNSSSRKRKRGGYSSPDMSDHCSCCAHGVKRRYHASDSSATPTSANAHAFTVQASSTLSTESRPRMSPSPVVDVIGIHLSPPKSVPLSPLSMPPTNVRAQTAGSNVNHESTSNSTSSFSDSSSLENDTAAPSKPGSSAKFALTQKKELAKAAGQSKSASIPAATGSSTLSNVPSNQASGVKATGQSKQPPPVVGSASSTSSSEYTSDFTSDDEQTTRTYPVVAKSAAKTVPAKGIVAKGGAAKGNPVKGTPAKGTPAKGTPTTATPAKGTPAKATPAKTAPAKGAPAKGTPANGVPQQKNNSKAATTATSSQASSAKVTVQATQRTDCVSSSESSSDDGVDLTSGDASEYTSNDEPIAAQKVPAKGSSPKALQKTNSKAGAKSDDTSECTSGDTTDYSSDDEPVAAKVPAKGPSPQAQSKTNSKTSAKSGDASEYSSDDEPVAAKKVPAKGPSPQAQSKTNSKTSAKSGDASEYSSDDEPVAAKKVPAKGPSPQAQSKTNSKTSAKSGGASEYSSDDEPVAAKKVPAKGPSPQAQSKTNSKTSAKSGGASEYSSDDEPVAAKKVLAKGSSSKAQQKTKLKAGAKSTKGGRYIYMLESWRYPLPLLDYMTYWQEEEGWRWIHFSGIFVKVLYKTWSLPVFFLKIPEK